MAKPKLTESEKRIQEARERSEEALAICDLANMKPDEAFIQEVERVINGEITTQQLIDETIAKYTKN